MSTMLRTNFEDLWFSRLPMIDHIIFMKYSMYPEEFSKFVKMNTSTRAFEQVTGVSELGLLAVKDEGKSIIFDNLLQTYDSTYTHLTYALGIRASMEAMQDDQDAIISKGAAALGRSARYTPEIISAAVFNDGFTSTVGSPDGVSLFSTAHPLRAGGTYANRPTTGADLSVISLQAGVNSMNRTPDDRGNLEMIKPVRLIVAPEGAWTAEQLLKSANLPGTTDNDINSLKMAGLTYDMWHYLTDLNAWFLSAPVSDIEVNFWWRMQFTTDHDVDYYTKDGLSSIIGRMSVGWSGWRGLYGNPGGS